MMEMENKETIEEAAERLYPTTFVAIFTQRDKVDKNAERRKIFIEGAKWQQERMYSDAIDLFITEIKNEFKDDNWDYLEFIKVRVIEQFKKK